MAGLHRRGRPFRARLIAPVYRTRPARGVGALDTARPREDVQLRRKNSDDVLWAGVPDGSAAVESVQSGFPLLRGYRLVSVDTPQRLRNHGNSPASGDGSGG